MVEPPLSVICLNCILFNIAGDQRDDSHPSGARPKSRVEAPPQAEEGQVVNNNDEYQVLVILLFSISCHYKVKSTVEPLFFQTSWETFFSSNK